MLLAGAIFVLTIVLVIWQPKGLGIGWSATLGAVLALVTGVVHPGDIPVVWNIGTRRLRLSPSLSSACCWMSPAFLNGRRCTSHAGVMVVVACCLPDCPARCCRCRPVCQ